MSVAVQSGPHPIQQLDSPDSGNTNGAHSLTSFSRGLPDPVIDDAAFKTASTILQVISRYRLGMPAHASTNTEEGDLKFLTVIYGHVRSGAVLPLCLPAFPFKSPNSSAKVLGKLPDRAEVVALACLNGLCDAIEDVYSPGAKLTIVSDGLVYNDLLGVPDRDVWAYGEALRSLAAQKGFRHIVFSRLRDLVSISLPDNLDEMTYVANASNFRRALLNTFGRPDWDWKSFSKSEDVCLTYRGYIKFLETDLRDVYPLGLDRTKSRYKRGIEFIAKEMMARGDSFAKAIRHTYPGHVRLSIHPSVNATKLSISLLPTTTIFTTPWHCAVAYMLDGTLVSGMRATFEKDDTMELVHENGRPSYFRQKSDLFSWGTEKGGVTCEPLYPGGWMFRPAAGPGAMNLHDVAMGKVRALSEINSPVILRGFVNNGREEDFIAKSEELGKPLGWSFGLVLRVKDGGKDTRGLNNVLSAEWMPFHYDGIFKVEKRTDEKGEEEIISLPPRFQFFLCATASPKNTGFTVFSSSTLVFRYLPSRLSVDDLAQKTWSISSPSFHHVTLKGLPLVISHPTTGKPCLRYHEPWPQSKTKFDPTEVKIDDVSEPESAALCEALDSLLHDRRIAYYHAWEKGDLVVSDNTLSMHTRSDFTSGSDRELLRIHVD